MNISTFAELVAGGPVAGRFAGPGFDTTSYLTVEASCEVRQHGVASTAGGWPSRATTGAAG